MYKSIKYFYLYIDIYYIYIYYIYIYYIVYLDVWILMGI